ncbi:NRAMP (natural resistance-associated macrophage protein)-like metal ion transporter [Undibacterium pigrum]|uniref:NRAMP (Natural resistance-associated macrophage protein)-like metal ion transporter n=2 Tax=Undibacterium pigrum TaxID=401470 RepID=A0A318JTM7_9BURK|nr:NRAMP (natural resistance-associated macrophage protein)-like metal ion transporter [Undibacterium pigrum]
MMSPVKATESMPLDEQDNDSVLAKLGPGLITGAADDDPSGIATYSQAGAQFGFNMLWTILLTYPLMCGIQIVSARIGRVSGHGLATNIARHYPKALLYFIIGSLLVANCINIGADLAAMGEATKLLLGGQAKWYAIVFGIASVLLQVFIPYQSYVRVLKWLTLALLAYVATVFVVRIPWGEVVVSTFVPQISLKPKYITTIVAVFGTTISPYLFFWQASQEVEELRAKPNETALLKAPSQAIRSMKRINIDTFIGMGFSNMVAFCIMLTTAATLHMHGHTDIQSSAQAASALKPIAGEFAFLLFSLGIIGTGLLAIPVLAGSSAYAIAGSFKWKNSLEHKPADARGFYAVIAISTVIGVILSLSNVDPIKALFWSAVINGIISVPVMVIMMLMAAKPEVMGQFVISRRLKALGWLATAMMAIAVLAMFFTL